MIELTFLKELRLIKQAHKKSVYLLLLVFFKYFLKHLRLNHMVVLGVMIVRFSLYLSFSGIG